MQRWILATALAALSACSPEPFTVIVSIKDTALVAYRDGDGAWKPVSPGRSGKARLKISSGYYSLAWICNNGPRAFVVHSTIGDEPRAHCGFESGILPVTLQGLTTPGATVYVGNQTTVAFEFGDYFMNVSPGFHDVVAMTLEQDRVLIQRDVDLRDHRNLDLPVADRGQPMQSALAMVFGPPQSVTLSSVLVTRNGDRVSLQAPADVVAVFPSQVLVDTDRAVVRVDGERVDGNKCFTEVRMGDASPQLELPEVPNPIVTGKQVFGVSDEWSFVSLSASPVDSGGLYVISATADWMDEADTGGLTIPDLSQLPEFTQGLLPIYPRDQVNWTFHAERGNRASSSFTSCDVQGSSLW